MNRARALRKVLLLIGLILSLSACADVPHAGDRLYYGCWRRGSVRHASWHGGWGHGISGRSDFGGHGEFGSDQRPVGNLVLSAPPAFSAIYPSSLGQAHGTVERYYEEHASEGGGRCLAPYVAGITNTQVVENAPERLVVDVRYLYRDRIKDQTRGNPADVLTSCIGFGERRFVFARKGDSLDVAKMSGPRRN
jgi:hypothetical protein